MTYRTGATRRVAVVVALALAALVAFAAVAQAKPKPKPAKPKGTEVTVMTRNLYLGADLSPAINSTSIQGFIEANGEILRNVDASNFPVRSKGLAEEILEQEPDLVGLQEAALWRTAEPSLLSVKSGVPTATTVKYDFLAELLKRLNKHGKKYRVAVVNPEFDFEAPADYNGLPHDGPGGGAPGLLENAEINARLTMRDAILARVGAGVKTSNPQKGHYNHLLVEKVAGSAEVAVTRGWVSVDATVRGSRKFHFVDTHLESFDPASVVPSIRAQQAEELTGPGGPATSKLPVILVGDLNSDVKTEVQPGDGQAYRVVTKNGFRERSTYEPLGCCIHSVDLKGGSVKQMDHKVDHIMTSDPKDVKLVSSTVTGRQKHNGWWDSDHAGLVSTLDILR
ncbi:MAG: endonuclease/exonuclease/phosphatase family protein [Actinobacteria bacterium]|nr:endonuclease/exonuclease/phosphatase family protein [Actinomycetota bacterium]